MPELNFREQSLVNSLQDRLKDADALTVDTTLKELEGSIEYQNPSNPDHHAYLNMVPVALAKKMELEGDDPNRSTRGLEGALDHQRFTHDPHPQESDELDFSDDDKRYDRERTNAQNYLNQLQNNEVPNIPEGDRDLHIQAAQKTILDIDADHARSVKTRESELSRMDDQQNEWDKESAERAAQMKKDFMAIKMKDVLPDEKEARQAQADAQWLRLSTEYGY